MIKYIPLLLFVLVCQLSVAQGIEFEYMSWEEALLKAQEENKVIFVDAYTTWCGPCKRMSKNVFPLQEVGDFYNANFVNIKLDMEKEEGRKFGRKYPVTAYPTFYFIDPFGNVVLTTKGGRQADDFIALGESAVDKYDGSAKYKKLYEEGNRDFETVYNYIVQLRKSGKSNLRVANDYLKTQDDLSTENNLRVILAAATQVDSKIFELLEENKKRIAAMEGREEVDRAIRSAALKTVDRGIEYEAPSLVNEAVAAMERHLPEEAEEFEVAANMKYALSVLDADAYYENGKIMAKEFAWKDAEVLDRIAREVIEYFPDHQKCLDLAIKTSKKATDIEPRDEYMIVFASATFLTGDKKKALQIVDEAIITAKFESRSTEKLELIRRQFESA